ncbi:MAG: DEAD/DEAH box helicase [Rhodobacteraceae bacterium]|nr:DEAD/DEAH box helicase [Paracoccaceae bacterium]
MTNFTDLDLDPKILKAIEDVGYESPTPIQAEAIPLALQGRDVLGIAQTGTGKTASFVLPMLNALSKGRARARMPRSLVLCPTRELAAQVAENFESYSKYLKLNMALLIGGVSFKDQDRKIDRGVDVLIATPGRLLDHFERGKLMLTGVQIMVVDEADRMLDMGFIPDIERIFKMTPFTRQTLFFSATMAPEITRITQEFLQNPARVEVARQATTGENITQRICEFKASNRTGEAREKRALLREILKGEEIVNGIIFCNRKSNVDIVMKSLKKHGFDAAAIHGDLDQSLRTRVLTSFREGELKLLVASDVAARGLDVPDVSHVINFDVPIHSEDYVHRIGRTGRAGRDGKAITIVMPFEQKYLDAIEDLVAKKIDRMETPKLGSSPAPRQERAPKPAPAPKPAQKTEQPEPKAEKAEKQPRNRNSNRGSDRRQDNRMVGMGDHVPAFIMREFRAPPQSKAAEPAPKAEPENGDTPNGNEDAA